MHSISAGRTTKSHGNGHGYRESYTGGTNSLLCSEILKGLFSPLWVRGITSFVLNSAYVLEIIIITSTSEHWCDDRVKNVCEKIKVCSGIKKGPVNDRGQWS